MSVHRAVADADDDTIVLDSCELMLTMPLTSSTSFRLIFQFRADCKVGW